MQAYFERQGLPTNRRSLSHDGFPTPRPLGEHLMALKTPTGAVQIAVGCAGLAVAIGLGFFLGSKHADGTASPAAEHTEQVKSQGSSGASDAAAVFQAAELAANSWQELGKPAAAAGEENGNYFNQGRKPFEAACANNRIWQRLGGAQEPLSDDNRLISSNAGTFLISSVWDRREQTSYAFAIGPGDGGACAGVELTVQGNVDVSARTASDGAAALTELAIPKRYAPDYVSLLTPTKDDRAAAVTTLRSWAAGHSPPGAAPIQAATPAVVPSYPRPLVWQFRSTLTGLSKAEVRAKMGVPFSANEERWSYMESAYDGDAGKIVSLSVYFDANGDVTVVESF